MLTTELYDTACRVTWIGIIIFYDTSPSPLPLEYWVIQKVLRDPFEFPLCHSENHKVLINIISQPPAISVTITQGTVCPSLLAP